MRTTKKDLQREIDFLVELTGNKFQVEEICNWYTLYQVNEDTSISRIALPDPIKSGLRDFVQRLRGFRSGLLYAKRGF